ncbi:amidophosphoribosyltransferase [Candidatus Gottesmanbacteria bacterium]|nr:amidophosphoribosyltransferase [Candidatus Gottesmanbacteria bacterium]
MQPVDIARYKYKETLHDQCGVFGIYAPDTEVAKITYYALHSLQHRGQEGAGIAVSDGQKLRSIRHMGLVTSVFNEENLSKLQGFIAVGHNRYSTTGGNTPQNTQPVIIPGNGNFFAVAHNGNIVNADLLAKKLVGVKRFSTSDTEVLALSIFHNPKPSWEEKILAASKDFIGAYSIIAVTKNKLFAFRDPWGIRPLVIGKLNGYYVVASETCALDTIGANYIRDVGNGEVISIDSSGLTTIGMIGKKPLKFCLFEYVYLARPDSLLNDVLVHEVRQRSGKILAHEAPVAGDLVVAVPDSGTSAALGYSQASGIPFGEVLIKNRYIGRTFIAPEQHIREQGVKAKFNPMKKIVFGKRLIVVDDSIVRGTTMKKIVEVLRKCGAREVHIRICSPPVRHSCYFGVDTPNRKHLIASHRKISAINSFIGSDSLRFLSLKGLIKASKLKASRLCTACFSGKYPMKVNYGFSKNILENVC